eukprot:TRINITY_DN11393_c0_g1_i1.p1 TRINITY_DN11393_c0_g1~~TRINITY_DN11393_c0_g1_i1.p1  ORF type:complete len:614 (+),score=202.41 TRINITY_DN11393_c0_g1_i1:55-1842(+)
MYVFARDTVKLSPMRVRMYTSPRNEALKERPASAFVHPGQKYVGRLDYDPELLKQDINTFVRALFPVATLKDVRSKLQPRARAKWDAKVEFTENQIHQYEELLTGLLSYEVSPQTTDLPVGKSFDTWEETLYEFIRDNTRPGNLGYDWKPLDKDEEEEEDEDDNDLEEAENVPAKLVPWFEQPFVAVAFPDSPESEYYDVQLEAMERHVKDMAETSVRNHLAKAFLDITQAVTFREKYDSYAEGAPQVSAEVQAKLDQLVKSLPENVNKFIKEADGAEARAQELKKGLNLQKVDASTRELLDNTIRSAIAEVPLVEFEKIFTLAERNATAQIFHNAVRAAREDGVPQLIPLIRFLKEVVLGEQDDITEKALGVIQKDIPGLFTFLEKRGFGENATFVVPSINFTETQAKKYTEKLRSWIKEGRDPRSYENHALKAMDKLETYLASQPPKPDDIDEEEPVEAEENADDEIMAEIDSETTPLVSNEIFRNVIEKRGIRVLAARRVAIISFKHAKLFLSQFNDHEEEENAYSSNQGQRAIVSHRMIDIPPQWLWSFKKVNWPLATEELLNSLEYHEPRFDSPFDQDIELLHDKMTQGE